MIPLERNGVYERTGPAGGPVLFRVIEISKSHVDLIRLDQARAQPESIASETLDHFTWKVGSDPWESLRATADEELTHFQRESRDRAFAAILKLSKLAEAEGAARGISVRAVLLESDSRARLIAAISNEPTKETKIAASTLRRWLGRWWTRGMACNACLPDTDTMSGKGKLRVVPREACDSAGNLLDPSIHRKIGRPPGRKDGLPSQGGIRMTEPIRDSIIETGVSLYLKNQKHSVFDAYTDWKTEIRKSLGTDAMPTMQAFYFVLRQNSEVAATIASRQLFGRKKKSRVPNEESTSTRVPGPGFRYQIDSTPYPGRVKFALADEADTMATIYFISDTYSKGIAGYYLGTKPANAEMAVKAFLQSTQDKVLYCLNYGVAITRSQWPMTTVPDELVPDRGELMGPVADILVSHYGVTVDNTPAYSPQLKADVEAAFGSLMRRVVSKIDDHVPARPGRKMGPDGSIPVITMKELHVLMILFILAYNSRFLDRIPSPSEVRRKVVLTPTGVWNSEHDRLRGEGRKFSPDELRIAVIKRGDGKLDIDGLHLGPLLYTCTAEGVKEFRERKGQRVRNVTVYYDEDVTDRIYVQAKVLKKLGVDIKLPHHKFIECALHTNSGQWAGFTFPRLREDMAKHNVTMQPSFDEKHTLDAALLAAAAAGKKVKPPTPLDEKGDQSATDVAAKIEGEAADTRLAGKDPAPKPEGTGNADDPGTEKMINSTVLDTLRGARTGSAPPPSP